jgi:ABC-2 type transport system ATP-binding protein
VEPALQLRGISKTFGETIAVQDMHLEVPPGALYGFIGPNGAGKTTCIRMVMSILFPDRGEMSVLGRASALEAKDRIGYLPEERGVYRKMRVGAFLTYMGRLKGLTSSEASARGRQLLERVRLPETLDRRCEDLSKGMLQRVQIAAAIMHRPDLLILDEPFSGLDPVSVRLLRDLIAEEHRRGTTILFSTHVMAHAEELCQHLVMIHRGRKVLDEATAALRRRFDTRRILFEPLAAEANVDVVRTLDGVVALQRDDTGYEVTLAGDGDAPAVMRQIAALLPVARLELARLRLDDIFIGLVSAGDAADAALRENLRGLQGEGVTA